MAYIDIQNLSVHFRAEGKLITAAEDVSLELDTRESFGLVGESGSGKTTVLRALAGLIAPTQGRILIDGREAAVRRPRELRRSMQFVFQDPWGSLHPKHTVDYIVREPARVHGADCGDRAVLAMFDMMGLDRSLRFRYPHQLSGGQRQRVAIARALLCNPTTLLLDEPTSALDVSVQAEILNVLSDLRESRGLTYVLVSHNLAVVAHLCQRVAVMQKGRVVEETTSDALREGLTSHDYTRLLIQASRGWVSPGERSRQPMQGEARDDGN